MLKQPSWCNAAQSNTTTSQHTESFSGTVCHTQRLATTVAHYHNYYRLFGMQQLWRNTVCLNAPQCSLTRCEASTHINVGNDKLTLQERPCFEYTVSHCYGAMTAFVKSHISVHLATRTVWSAPVWCIGSLAPKCFTLSTSQPYLKLFTTQHIFILL